MNKLSTNLSCCYCKVSGADRIDLVREVDITLLLINCCVCCAVDDGTCLGLSGEVNYRINISDIKGNDSFSLEYVCVDKLIFILWKL